MATSDTQVDERMALEERIARLKAVKCPGRTHGLIKNPALRREFARELWDWYSQRKQVLKDGMGALPDELWKMWREGLDSGFWAMQKAENRAFLYEHRRVTWQLAEEEDTRGPEEKERYAEYEAAVIATHMNTLRIVADIEAEFKAGKLDELQRARARNAARTKEDAKIEALQAEYRK